MGRRRLGHSTRSQTSSRLSRTSGDSSGSWACEADPSSITCYIFTYRERDRSRKDSQREREGERGGEGAAPASNRCTSARSVTHITRESATRSACLCVCLCIGGYPKHPHSLA